MRFDMSGDEGSVAASRLGDTMVAIEAGAVLHVMDDDGEGRAVDLAVRFGLVAPPGRRGLVVETARGPMRLRVGAEVQVVPSPRAGWVELPWLVAPLCTRLGILALAPVGEELALVLDVDRLWDDT